MLLLATTRLRAMTPPHVTMRLPGTTANKNRLISTIKQPSERSGGCFFVPEFANVTAGAVSGVRL
jgi:hypothetical protein